VAKILVHTCGYRHTDDIDPREQKSASKWQGLATVCVSRSRDSLKKPMGTYTKLHRDTMSDLLNAMLVTHSSIGKLLSGGSDSPESVDALALARLQIEGLFTICLLTEGSSWAEMFLRDGWKKQFVRYLLIQYETTCLPRFETNAHIDELSRLVKFREVCDVSLAQMHTIEHEQTGTPMPTGMTREGIPNFPTPSKVIDALQAGCSKRRMLERLYLDYAYLCSFSHALQAANMSKYMYDPRVPERQFFGESYVEEVFQQEVNTNALTYSFLGIAQASAEITSLYSNDMDLTAAVGHAWNDLLGATFFVNAVWNLRTKQMLGII